MAADNSKKPGFNNEQSAALSRHEKTHIHRRATVFRPPPQVSIRGNGQHWFLLLHVRRKAFVSIHQVEEEAREVLSALKQKSNRRQRRQDLQPLLQEEEVLAASLTPENLSSQLPLKALFFGGKGRALELLPGPLATQSFGLSPRGGLSASRKLHFEWPEALWQKRQLCRVEQSVQNLGLTFRQHPVTQEGVSRGKASPLEAEAQGQQRGLLLRGDLPGEYFSWK